jgi:hypothetical protein
LPAGTAVRATGFLAGAGRPFAIALTAAFGNAFRAAGAFFAEVFAAGLERERETDFDEALAMVSVTVAVRGTGTALTPRFHAAVQALPLLFHSPKPEFEAGFKALFKAPARGKISPYTFNLSDDAEAENADEDQVQRDDVVQQTRHDENENAGNERDDGLKLADIDGHVFSPFRNCVEIRIAARRAV